MEMEAGTQTIAAFCGEKDEEMLEAIIGRPPNTGKTWHLTRQEYGTLESNGLVTIN